MSTALRLKHLHDTHLRPDLTPIMTELSDLVGCFDQPICVYAPDVALENQRRGQLVTSFDVRSGEAVSRKWDFRRPIYVEDTFDFILCAASEHEANADQLFHGVRILSHFDFKRPLLIVQPEHRLDALLTRFEAFDLRLHGMTKGGLGLLSNFDLPLL